MSAAASNASSEPAAPAVFSGGAQVSESSWTESIAPSFGTHSHGNVSPSTQRVRRRALCMR